jgi:hypothetical protein
MWPPFPWMLKCLKLQQMCCGSFCCTAMPDGIQESSCRNLCDITNRCCSPVLANPVSSDWEAVVFCWSAAAALGCVLADSLTRRRSRSYSARRSRLRGTQQPPATDSV